MNKTTKHPCKVCGLILNNTFGRIYCSNQCRERDIRKMKKDKRWYPDYTLKEKDKYEGLVAWDEPDVIL